MSEYDPADDARKSYDAAIEAKRLRGDRYWPGDRFGRLTVLAGSGAGSRPHWRVRCDCGTEKTIRVDHITSGRTRSCGCLSRELAAQRTSERQVHGMSRTPTYKSWQSMIQRCENENADQFGRYGAKGIAVCARWRHGEGETSGFQCFYEDMGPRPSLRHTLDRYPDQTGNYEASNCRWATSKDQNRNLRSNRIVEYEGETMSLAEACERAGIRYKLTINRLAKGWSLSRAMHQPARVWKRRGVAE